MGRICEVKDCYRSIKGRGLCSMHYQRWRKTGRTGGAIPETLTGQHVTMRLWPRIQIDWDSDCWIFTGAINSSGYGSIRFNGRNDKAHRVAWVLHGGLPVPDGMIVRHRCDNRACINPEHLELGTHADNARDRDERNRNGFSGRTHCSHGHEYTDDNTYHWNGTRHCRACRTRWHSQHRRSRH